jgi:DNA ligase-1
LSARSDEFDDFSEVEIDVNLKKLKPWRFPRLFTRRKPSKRAQEDGENGALAFWEIGFDGVYLITRWGQANEGAKVQSSSKEVKTNKSGRTMIQQALLEGRKKYNDKVRDGDAVTDPELARTPIRPTLAYPYKDGDWKRAKKWLASPKVDGGRMLVFRSRKRKLMRLTRKKKEVPSANLEHQEEETHALLDKLPEGSVLDIECCLPGETFQRFTSYWRCADQMTGYEDLRSYILDVILPENNKTFAERHKILKEAYNEAFENVYIEDENGQWKSRSLLVLGCFPVRSPAAVVEMHEVFLGMKYEGLMLRDAESLYEFGRTHALLKVKKWFDEEATIVDVTEGKGKMEGKAVFICENKEGQQFRVSMAATMERREEMFQRKNSLIGKELTYTYFEETDDGLPRFPVGIDIRDYE